MKFISKTNTTTKILLLAIYVAILTSLILIVSGINKTTNPYKDYGTNPSDENMDISIRLKERRTAPSGSNDLEDQYWDLQVYLHLKDQNAIYRNVTVYTAIEKNDGTFKYEEKTVSVLTGVNADKTLTDATTDRNVFSSYGATSKTMVYDSTTKEYTKNDGAPDKIYVKVVYTIREDSKEEQKELTYQCDVIKSTEEDFTKYQQTEIYKNEKEEYVDLNIENSPLSVKVKTTLVENEKESDTYRINLYCDPYDEEGNNRMKSAAVALFLKSKNLKSDKDNYFSDYIEFVQYYGAIPYLYTIPQLATAYVGDYDVDNLYVYTNINYVNGKTDTSKVYIPVSELPKN
jgi:hypothetical protein